MKDKFNNAVGPQVRVDKPKAGKIIPVLAVVFMLAGLQSQHNFLPMNLDASLNWGLTISIFIRLGASCYGPINGVVYCRLVL